MSGDSKSSLFSSNEQLNEIVKKLKNNDEKEIVIQQQRVSQPQQEDNTGQRVSKKKRVLKQIMKAEAQDNKISKSCLKLAITDIKKSLVEKKVVDAVNFNFSADSISELQTMTTKNEFTVKINQREYTGTIEDIPGTNVSKDKATFDLNPPTDDIQNYGLHISTFIKMRQRWPKTHNYYNSVLRDDVPENAFFLKWKVTVKRVERLEGADHASLVSELYFRTVMVCLKDIPFPLTFKEIFPVVKFIVKHYEEITAVPDTVFQDESLKWWSNDVVRVHNWERMNDNSVIQCGDTLCSTSGVALMSKAYCDVSEKVKREVEDKFKNIEFHF